VLQTTLTSIPTPTRHGELDQADPNTGLMRTVHPRFRWSVRLDWRGSWLLVLVSQMIISVDHLAVLVAMGKTVTGS
jgi:hypothetical protein